MAAGTAAVGKVFARIHETRGGKGETPIAEIDPAKTTRTPAGIESILGTKGQLKDGVYRVVIGRTVDMHGAAMGATMGVNT